MAGDSNRCTNRKARAEEFLEDLNALFARAVRNTGDAGVLQHALDAGVRAVGGNRGFLAIVHHETGELTVCCTNGEGWTEEARRLRVHLAQEDNRGITGQVAVTGQPYITGDIEKDPIHVRYFEDAKSEIAVPILGAQGQTRGVINVDSPVLDAFDAEDCAHLTALAQAAGVALVLDGFSTRESALIEIGMNLTSTLELDELMNKVVDIAADALQFEDCSVFLIDEQSEHLVLRASRGKLAPDAGAAEYHLGEGLTGWVAQNGQPIRLEKPNEDPRWKGRYTEFPLEEIGAFLAVPIVSRDKILGVLRVLRRKSHSTWFSNRFTETDERVLSTIAGQLGAAVENARIFQRLVRAERMAAWGELSARSAHMIGNRTFALKGDLNELSYLLGELPGGKEQDELQDVARSMGRGIQRLEELLREFRDFVVATQLTLATADINEVLREVAAESFPKRSNVKLDMQLAEGLPPLRCDESKLKRALSELIENAVSFQTQGGFVRVASRLLTQADRVGYRLAHSREFVEIEVADGGPGVPTELKERIFQPFFTSRQKGMGLGLSIVKGIIEGHQGRIREVGEPGQGARFLIFLPVNGH